MGDRWIIYVHCARCGYEDNDVPYAPTSGFTTWRCPSCKRTIRLKTYIMRTLRALPGRAPNLMPLNANRNPKNRTDGGTE